MICRHAGLPVRLFHTLRHTFGTHAALFGVNPWRLQAWLGHKRLVDVGDFAEAGEEAIEIHKRLEEQVRR